MKVLYVAPYHPDDYANAASIRFQQITSFLGKCTELKVIGITVSGEALVKKQNNLITVPQIKSSPIDLIKGVFSTDPEVFKRFSSDEIQSVFKQVEEEFQPDIVHFDTFGCLGLSRFSKTKRKVFHIHDCVSKKYAGWIKSEKKFTKKIHYLLQERKVRNAEKSLFSNNSVCIVDSEEDANVIRNETSARVEVIPLGFDQDIYNPNGNKVSGIPEDSLIFSGSMASLQTLVGVRWLINEIMPRVWESFPDVKVLLVGSKPQQEIKAFAEKDNRIIVTGFVDDLSEYLRSASIYVCTLKIGSGMKTRVIEALATGCAMVTTSQGVAGLLTTSPLPWIECNTPIEFSNSVIALLKDNKLRRKLSQDAARFSTKYYSWQNTGSQIFSLYSELMKS